MTIDSATEMHERLDKLGYLEDSKSKGVYSISLLTPDNLEDLQRDWLRNNDRPMPDQMAVQIANSSNTAYVGESGDVYDRLMDHARGDVRRAALVSAYPIVDVVGVWPGERSATAERDRAREVASASTAAYANGELF